MEGEGGVDVAFVAHETRDVAERHRARSIIAQGFERLSRHCCSFECLMDLTLGPEMTRVTQQELCARQALARGQVGVVSERTRLLCECPRGLQRLRVANVIAHFDRGPQKVGREPAF